MWNALQKTQKCGLTLHYSSCDDTPTAGTVAVTTGGVSLLICKNIFFLFSLLSHDMRYIAVATIHLLLQLRWQHAVHHHMGCRTVSQRTFEILIAHSTSTKIPPFLGPVYEARPIDCYSSWPPSFVAALQRKSHLCIPFLGIARPQPQFPHSCVCERFI